MVMVHAWTTTPLPSVVIIGSCNPQSAVSLLLLSAAATTREEDLELTRQTIMTMDRYPYDDDDDENEYDNDNDEDIDDSTTVLRSSRYADARWDIVMKGLLSYHATHGNILVPATFVIPSSENDNDDDDDNAAWPAVTQGLPLGSIVHRIRLRRDFLSGDDGIDRRAMLDKLGFVWDVGEYNFDKFVRALHYYDRLSTSGMISNCGDATLQSPPQQHQQRRRRRRREYHYSVRIPTQFVVPNGTESGWPIDLWNYPLGARTVAVRQKQLYIRSHPRRKQILEDLGFRWRNGNADLGWLDVVHAAAIYSQLHGRVLNVPLSFAVPAPPPNAVIDDEQQHAWPWPERLWGLKLGQRLKDVRLEGAYLKGTEAQLRKAQLDNLGFVWTPKRGRTKRYIEEEDETESLAGEIQPETVALLQLIRKQQDRPSSEKTYRKQMES
jgi:hypothetical protein